MTYEAIARRLAAFVHQLLGDVRFRRRLRYYPAQALAEHGLPAADAPLELPVRHWTIAVSIDVAHLCGGLQAPRATAPPLAARLVALGGRPLALVHGPEAELIALRRWGEAHGLVGLLTPWQLALRTDAGKGGFSNLADEEPAVAGSGAHRGLLVAADAGQAMLGWLALLCRWDAFLGRLLGYPVCCADAFATRWAEAKEHHQGDVAGLVAKTGGPGPFPWPLNPFLRYGGRELVPHFPCRFDCPASLDLARRLLAVLDLAEPEDAAALRRDLPALVLYTETNGVFACRDAEVRPAGDRRELVAQPTGVFATEGASPLARAWRAGAQVTIGAGDVVAGDVCTAGWLVDFRAAAPGFATPGGHSEGWGGGELAPWLAVGSGVVNPGAGARLPDLARLLAAAGLRRQAIALAARGAALAEPPRDVARFATGVAGHVAESSLMELPTMLPLGRATLALTVAHGGPAAAGSALAAIGALAGGIAGRLEPGAGVVVPREAFAGPAETLDLFGPHVVVAAAGGPVALRGPDERSPGGAGLVVTWVDGAAARFEEPPRGAIRAGESVRLEGGASVDGWPVLTVDAEGRWRIATSVGDEGVSESGAPVTGILAPAVEAGELAALRDALDLAGALCPEWLQTVQRSVEALAIVPPRADGAVGPPPLPDVLAVPAAALAGVTDPLAWLRAAGATGMETVAAVDAEATAGIAVAAAAAASPAAAETATGGGHAATAASDAGAVTGVDAEATSRDFSLPQPLAGSLVLAAAEGRRRVTLAWPLLTGGSDDLPACWAAGARSRLADAVAALDAWRLLLVTLERLAERDPESAPPAAWALLGVLRERALPEGAELGAGVSEAVAVALAAELAAAASPLHRRTAALTERAARARDAGSGASEPPTAPSPEPAPERGSLPDSQSGRDVGVRGEERPGAGEASSGGAAGHLDGNAEIATVVAAPASGSGPLFEPAAVRGDADPMPLGASTAAPSGLTLAAADLAAARARFQSDGVCELPAPVLDTVSFQALGNESVEQARHAWASDRASPPQSCWRADLGPAAFHVMALLQPVVEWVTAARLEVSREASCYTYYLGPGSFGGRHQDRAGSCTVTCLVYLHAEASGAAAGPGMTLRVWRHGEPATARPFAVVPTIPNLGVVLLGSRLPHERPQLAAGESVALLALCFGVAGEAVTGARR